MTTHTETEKGKTYANQYTMRQPHHYITWQNKCNDTSLG